MRIKPLAALVVSMLSTGSAMAAASFSFDKQWTYVHDMAQGRTGEIAAFDQMSNSIWVAGVVGVDVLDASNGSLLLHIDTSAFGGAINSVAIKNGLAAVAIESGTRTNQGIIQFFDTGTRALATGFYGNTVTVGALPDMLTFTPDGSKLLVANEATPTTYGAYDPAGSVSIIDVNTRSVIATAVFAGVTQTGSAIRSNTGMDFEPEYIAINAAGTKAFVSLQEANAMGVLDLSSNTFSQVIGLGTKDFSAAGNEIDPSHKDGKIELRSVAVKGLYQPDGMATFEKNGQTYIVMANEGDTREDDGDKARAKDVAAFTDEPADLKQLNISTTDSTSGTDLVTFGGRSFSIRDENGNIVFDSGNTLDSEAIARGIYNDGRSDDKGVEPEGVTLLEINGRTLAFIGLERTTKSTVAVYDITNPANATFLDMIVTDGDLAPEGLTAYVSGNQYFLAIANEGVLEDGIAGSTTLYSMTPVPEPETYAMMLAGLGLVGFMGRRRKSA